MGRFALGFVLGFVATLAYPRERVDYEQRLTPLQARARELLDDSLRVLQQTRGELVATLRARGE